MPFKDKIVIGEKTDSPLEVSRLGYGTMRLTGPHIWGEPQDRPQALQVLKKAVASGVNFLDTADYYGQDVTNRLIAEALYPYPDDLIICTKVGGARKEDASWIPYATPQNLRDSIDKNLLTLRLGQIPVVHLRFLENPVPFAESLETMFDLQKEGKILHVGLSNVSREQLQLGLSKGSIATVSNMYGYSSRITQHTPYGENYGGEEILDICEQEHIPMIPYLSLVTTKDESKLAEMAEKYGVSKTQINLAWLLHKSDWLLPIPGTSSLDHLEANLKSASIRLSEEDLDYLG